MAIIDFKVSVIIPVFNTAQYITEAVESAVYLPEAGEVILVDDGSTDGSLSLCYELEKKYSKVRVLQHPDKKNCGVGASRNLGIQSAHFDFISFLDADDYYLSNRFTKDKEIFTSSPEVDGVYGCNQAVFENEIARAKFMSLYESEQTTVVKVLPPQELFRALIFGGYGRFHTSAITLRKQAFRKAGLFNTLLRMNEDTELWLKLSLKAVLVAGRINEPVAIRRVHDRNSIHDVENVCNYRRQMYQELFDWAMCEKFRFEVKNSFFITLHRFGKEEAYNAKKLLWMQVVRKPQIIITTFFYKKIHQLYFIH
jgi:glycosyltransferase involved in cell wall biosynthesis